MNHGFRWVPALLLLLVGCASPPANESESLLIGRNVLPAREIRAAMQETVNFSRHVKPIFQAKCVVCHDSAAQPLGIHLDSRAAAVKSGALGGFIIPGSSKMSLLFMKIDRTPAHIKTMPPVGEQLTSDEIAILRRWIDQGAMWPASE
jgi:mono/diheme cytochrome c family protein